MIKKVIKAFCQNNLIKTKFNSINQHCTINMQNLKEALSLVNDYPSLTPPTLMVKIENLVLNKIMAFDLSYFLFIYKAFSKNKEGSNKLWYYMDRRLISQIVKMNSKEIINLLDSFLYSYNKSNKIKMLPYICSNINNTIDSFTVEEVLLIIDKLYGIFINMDKKEHNSIILQTFKNCKSILLSKWVYTFDIKKEDEEEDEYNFPIDDLIEALYKLNEVGLEKNFDINIKLIQKLLPFFTNKSIYYLLLLGYGGLEEKIVDSLSYYTPYEVNIIMRVIKNNKFYSSEFKLKVFDEFIKQIDEDYTLMSCDEMILYIQTLLEYEKEHEKLLNSFVKRKEDINITTFIEILDIVNYYQHQLSNNVINQSKTLTQLTDMINDESIINMVKQSIDTLKSIKELEQIVVLSFSTLSKKNKITLQTSFQNSINEFRSYSSDKSKSSFVTLDSLEGLINKI